MNFITLLLCLLLALIGTAASRARGKIRSHSGVNRSETTTVLDVVKRAQSPAQKKYVVHASVLNQDCVNQTKSRIYTFDFDDVVNIRERLGLYECACYGKLLVKLAVQEPAKVGTFLWNWRSIKARVKELSNEMHGATKIIHTLSAELVEKGHLDIAPYADNIIAYFVKPKPIWSIIDYIKELKKQGYVVLGATNQDYSHNKYIRAKMAQQGVDLDELFDAIVISHTTTQVQHITPHDALMYEIEPGVYMPCSPEGHKPHAHFYEALKAVGILLVPTAELFIHTDDRLENIHGAKSVQGFAAVHFNLPDGKSARRCTSAELDAAFLAWKSEIEKIN